ncbi:MAG: hypothetical protein AB6733_07625 [Clostridiaceae bacterium]
MKKIINEVVIISLLKKVFNIGKKKPKLMQFIAYLYNCFSFTKTKIKGKNNKIIKKTAFLKNNKVTIYGDNNRIEFESGTRIKNCSIYICGNNHNLIIKEDCNCLNSEFYFEDYNCQINIGFNTSVLGVHFAVTERNSKIIIGENCTFSRDIEIRTGDSHSIIDVSTNKRINYAKNVIIEDHVWIGAHSRLLKGSKISKNSVVANSAVVTKEFSTPNCIIGGFPAKVIKENINWLNERISDN